jgi:Uma2 family endonuclease
VLPGLRFPRVGVDNAGVGRLAAAHFLERGLNRFGFIGPPDYLFATERGVAFCQAVREAGHAAACYEGQAHLSYDPLGQRWDLIPAVRRWLRALPRPVGAFVPNDLWGVQVAEECRRADLRVPEDVALLGVDNDDLCEKSSPVSPTEVGCSDGDRYIARYGWTHSMRGTFPMSSALTPDAPPEDVAELLERLGNIPPERIRLRPPPGTATEADVLAALEAPRKRLCELIDGVLVEKAMGYTESVLATYLIELLNAFVRPRNLGLITSPDGTIRLWAGRVRIPDIAFFPWGRMPGRRRPPEPIPTLAPDLAVEILSTSNTRAEMRLKRQDDFSVGVRLVWEIDPVDRTVTVYTAPETGTVLAEADTLGGGAVLAGFALPLREFFAELDRQG